MDSVLLVQLVVLVILLMGSAFFSASETALMSISKIDARHMVDQNIKNAKIVSKLVEDPNKLLGAILVGNNIVNIGASSLATVVATGILGSAGAGIATGVMTLLVLIFGEITPKSLSTQKSQEVACFVARPISLVVLIFTPVVKVLMFISNLMIRLFGGKIDTSKPFITTDELKTIVTVSHEEGVLEEEEKEMIYNVFGFGDSYTKDVMIPRTDMIAVDVNATYDEIIELYKQEQFSRMPVYQESHDNIIGVIYMKDLLLKQFDPKDFVISDFLRDVYFVHEFKRIDELFKEMRSKKIGMAIVVDEYGGTSGIVTLEDLIEEIVGDIDDEYDMTEDSFVKIADQEYLVDGSFRISDFNDELNLDISSNEFDSIGGFIIGLLDRFPDEGEVVVYDDITFKVEETMNNRINKLRILLSDDIKKDSEDVLKED
ncbi:MULTISPECIES: HlyC/CorC family transporter [Zhenhengia]|uniref:HlyC/CorC family transporter n=1 Tax=Zhenhengia yiwuensis TaxID=2763666 RepID=A0A926EGT2_9FIRM|nr:hemolysin family protein [Zhenhengia yiwuensis]MBP3911766.1 HlyC/CorC family transporter [Niameybacter sp.]MBS5317103.1 HlyC/CorC family transporter [Clostridiales bacterium]MBC8580054.1 HlyC/CorC family transporter [Zhenhengia yiwuensis]MBS5799182.1 HlyC/CorC family transporter [Clostridiales bacterium]MDU6358614.1 hemolysin family protein [Clostridiales bacterium]